jgi:hypothetical protein
MTKKEKIFRHIEDCGNEMRYTDIIKFAFELSHPLRHFDKRSNRGYYANAFSKGWNNTYRFKQRPGHLVDTNGRFGYLEKKSNGLYRVVRPASYVRSNEEIHKTQAEKVLTILSKQPYITEKNTIIALNPNQKIWPGRRKGYDYGNTNNLLRKLIRKGLVIRKQFLNPETSRLAYFYKLTTPSAISDKIDIAEYIELRNKLVKHNISQNTFDDTANVYFQRGDGDIVSCYYFAYYDLITAAHAENTKAKKAMRFEFNFASDENIDTKKTNDSLEIIGYSCPSNYFGGVIIKGDVYIKSLYHPDLYTPKRLFEDDSQYTLPSEIVESWQPIYKKDFVTIELGEPLTSFVIKKNIISMLINGSTIFTLQNQDIHDIDRAASLLDNIEGVTAKISIGKFPNSVKITSSDIEDIIFTQKSL